MPVNINKEKVTLNKIVARDTFITWIEQDILIPDTKPDVMKVLKVEALPFVKEQEVQDGVIRLNGEITYYILYRPASGEKIKGIAMSYPFTQSIAVPNVLKNMQLSIKPTIRNVVFSLLNERKVSLKSELVIKYKVINVEDAMLPIGIEDNQAIQVITQTQNFENIVAIKTELIDIKEDVMLPENNDGAVELIKAKAKINDTEYKISYNKVLVKGVLQVNIMYMQSDKLSSYVTDIPFAGMVEVENISDEKYKFDINYQMTSFNINLGGIDTNTANITADILVTLVVTEPVSHTVITDMYSVAADLKYEKKVNNMIQNTQHIEKELQLKDKVGTVDKNLFVIDYTLDKESINSKISGGNLYLNGHIKINVMYENSENGAIESKNYELPVDETISLNKEVVPENVDVDINIIRSDIQIVQNSLDVNITLKIIVSVSEMGEIMAVEDIEEVPIDEGDFDSMYIYIVKKGDTLWNIAKRYKTTVAKIANTNNIKDENKIDISQKLLLIR